MWSDRWSDEGNQIGASKIDRTQGGEGEISTLITWMAKLSHTRLEAKMTALGEPVMSKTRSDVPGYRSECEDTLTRAPEMSMSGEEES